MEAESGGEVFNVEADRVVLSTGAIKSPHLLVLSGIGPEDQLQQFGIPTVHELPGVGQSLWNHLSAQITFKVKEGMGIVYFTRSLSSGIVKGWFGACEPSNIGRSPSR